MASNKRDLTQGPVGPTLVRLTGPMTIGILSLLAFNLIDTYFVGQLGKEQLAALSFTFPVILVVFSLAQGIGIGATALVAKSIGKGLMDKARRETTDSLVLALGLVLIFVTIGLFTMDPVFRALGASGQTLVYIKQYMTIWYFTLAVVIIPFVGNSAIRATGDTRTPSLIMVFAVIINAILDPLLIWGYGPFPELGVQGAALATAISRGLTMLLAMYILYFREKLITLKIPPRSELLACWGSILYIGIPNSIARMVTPLAIGVVTAMIAPYGEAAVAAFGAGGRLASVGLSILWALAASISPFVGQNLGQGKYKRIRKAVWQSNAFCMAWGLFIALVFYLLRYELGPIFNDDPRVGEYLALYLLLVPLSIGFEGAFLVVESSMNTLNKPIQALILSLIAMFGFYVPFAWLGGEWLGIEGLWGSMPISYAIAAVMAYVVHRMILNRLMDKHPEPDEEAPAPAANTVAAEEQA